MKRWITSDTHFYHANIIKYCDRPFEDTKEMNKHMIKQWNKVVGKNDIVFHLGDFAFARKSTIKEIVSELNGRIVLIMGNHDKHVSKQVQTWYELGFHEVYKYGILVEGFFWLTHEPMTHMDERFPYVNIHGHIHNNKMESNNYVNVCVENHNYQPIDFDSLIGSYIKEGQND